MTVVKVPPDPRHDKARTRPFALSGCNCDDCTHWNREFLALRETILRINRKPYTLTVTGQDPLTVTDELIPLAGTRWTFL